MCVMKAEESFQYRLLLKIKFRITKQRRQYNGGISTQPKILRSMLRLHRRCLCQTYELYRQKRANRKAWSCLIGSTPFRLPRESVVYLPATSAISTATVVNTNPPSATFTSTSELSTISPWISASESSSSINFCIALFSGRAP